MSTALSGSKAVGTAGVVRQRDQFLHFLKKETTDAIKSGLICWTNHEAHS